MVERIARKRFLLIRALRIAASAPKKQQLASECPLGKLYVGGGNRSKKGSGRARLNASFRVVFSSAAPSIVSKKSFASRPHFRRANIKITMPLAIVRKRVEPRKEMPRMIVVRVGVANWRTAALVASSNCWE